MQGLANWHYYNHAMVPSCAPHEKCDLQPIKDGTIFKLVGGGQTPLLVRFTTDFDCKKQTNFWYIIKDEPFDIKKPKANYRFKINKANKLFETKVINPQQYANELYEVCAAAYSAYPAKYRPKINKEDFIKSVSSWSSQDVFGAFFKETGKLCGYSLISRRSRMLGLNVQKTMPAYEKFQINAALVYTVLEHYKAELQNGFYICDGARSILHETHFQDYLEKYFGFRKAYCRLYVIYSPKIKWAIKLLRPFRRFLLRFNNIELIHKINGALLLDSFRQPEADLLKF